MVPVTNPKTCVCGTPEQGARETGKAATRPLPAASEVTEAKPNEGAAKRAIAQQIGLNDTVKVADGSTEVYGNGFRGN